ncbi:MAG: helix-turn-helix domain-containing protein, partial [Cyanobacteria bacterium J06639_1]
GPYNPKDLGLHGASDAFVDRVFDNQEAKDLIMGALDRSRGVVLPWTLTHSQIGDAIGATRVTVTRSLGTLRSKGFVKVLDQNQLCLPNGPSLLKKGAEDYSYSSAMNLVQGNR